MDYYLRLQQAIDYIDGNLTEDISMHEIAEQACFSVYHFQRLFHALTGFTVYEYLRNRRLTEAAARLHATGDNVLAIALCYQYGSQEAFTRAFEHCYGMTPARYRNVKQHTPKQAKMNFLAAEASNDVALNMEKPNIVTLEAMPVVAYTYETTLEGNRHWTDIPTFWEDNGRQERYLAIPNRKAPGIPYGIVCPCRDDGSFRFLIGEEVSLPVGMLPSGYCAYEIAGGRYAEFNVYGLPAVIQDTIKFIYTTWFPNTNYARREDGADLERYDLWKCCESNLSAKILIPLK